MKLLELFSGTQSIGNEARKRNWNVVSLDRDLPSDIKEDILTWDYKIYPTGHFDLITASPVCLYWSLIRKSWIGRKLKMHGDVIITKEILENDINKFGKPMVDKLREIINYFKPKYWWIENPKSSSMKNYITDLPYYDVDYCQYSNWGYKKPTRFWTNIKNFTPKTCHKLCPNIITGTKRHSLGLGGGRFILDGELVILNTKEKRDKYKKKQNVHKIVSEKVVKSTTKKQRYRIPSKLINDLFDCCII